MNLTHTQKKKGGIITHKSPARTPLGIKFSTCKNGPVKRTRQSDPCARFDIRCSTTAIGTSCIVVIKLAGGGKGPAGGSTKSRWIIDSEFSPVVELP